MLLKFDPQFKEDLKALRKEDARLPYKVWELLFDLIEQPFDGIGKPEPLKGNLKGCWSRRIDQKHRIVYRVTEDSIVLLSCYGHYSD